MGKNLITGGLGRLGPYLARRLVEDGEDVVLFQRRADARFISDIRDKVKIVQGDMSNWTDVFKVVAENDIDCIYHLATMMVETCETNPQKGYMVNTNGFFYLLEAARLFNVGSVIDASTHAAWPLVIDGKEVLPPVNMYGMSKCMAEWLGLYYHRRYGINFRAATMGEHIGATGRYSGISRWTTAIIQEPALGRPYRAYVEESWPGHLLYVKDSAYALVDLKRADESKLTRRIYDLELFAVTAGELAAAVKKVLPQAQIEFVPDNPFKKYFAKPEESVTTAPDPDRAKKDWGHHLRYSFDEAIREIIEEIQANRAIYETIPSGTAYLK